MPISRSQLHLIMIAFLSIPLIPAGPQAQAVVATYRAQTDLWRAVDFDFASWQRDAVSLLPDGTLQLDPRTAHQGTDPYGPGKYKSGNFYNASSFVVGEATGPVVTPAFPFSEAVPSWNADTPPGTWIEVQLRARVTSTRWTSWYNLGVWAGGDDAITRHSVTAQTDSNAYVDVDTLKLGKRGSPSTVTAYQLKFRLFATSPDALPTLRNAAVVVSTKPAAPSTVSAGNPARWNKLLSVPECSQMVYPDGGEVWCSPTSVAMVLGYWAGRTNSGSCNADVRAAVSGVYDRIYKGHGNWPFNTAYAANHGMEAYVSRFTSLSQAEDWIAAGVPVIMSVSWSKGQLTNAATTSTAGHLIVLVGFDAKGNAIVKDPAAPANEFVQRTYLRPQLEKLWQQASGGTVYLIYPAGKAVPAY